MFFDTIHQFSHFHLSLSKKNIFLTWDSDVVHNRNINIKLHEAATSQPPKKTWSLLVSY